MTVLVKSFFALVSHPVGQIITLIFVGTLTYQAGNHIGSKQVRTLTKIDTVYAERALVKRDTLRVYEPYQVTIFDTLKVTELRTDTIKVPVNFGVSGVIGENPVTRKGRDLVLTSFDLGQNAFVQRAYAVPRRRFTKGLFLSVGKSNITNDLNLSLDLGFWERLYVSPYVGVQSQFMHTNDETVTPGIIAGVNVKWKLF